MSREIKCRAKRKDNGEFIYGWYVECPFGRWPLTPAIIDSELARNGHYEPVEIDVETLGRYTGLHDKNGEEIYEGDIVKMHCFCEYHVLEWTRLREVEVTGMVAYEKCAQYGIVTEEMFYAICNYVYDPDEELEVISNIY